MEFGSLRSRSTAGCITITLRPQKMLKSLRKACPCQRPPWSVLPLTSKRGVPCCDEYACSVQELTADLLRSVALQGPKYQDASDTISEPSTFDLLLIAADFGHGSQDAVNTCHVSLLPRSFNIPCRTAHGHLRPSRLSRNGSLSFTEQQ